METTRAIDWKRIARLLREIADEIDPPGDGAPPLTELDQARAKRALKRLGYEEPKPKKRK